MKWDIFWAMLTAMFTFTFVMSFAARIVYRQVLKDADAKLRLLLADFDDFNYRTRIIKARRIEEREKWHRGDRSRNWDRTSFEHDEMMGQAALYEERAKFTGESYFSNLAHETTAKADALFDKEDADD